MSDNNYYDPVNKQEIIDNINKSPTLKDVKDILDETFPTLFIGIMKKYSDDYTHLQENWNKICKQIGINTTQIIIFDDFPYDDTEEKHELAKLFSECFTKAGFSVRRKSEYIPCKTCDLAIPTKRNVCVF